MGRLARTCGIWAFLVLGAACGSFPVESTVVEPAQGPPPVAIEPPPEPPPGGRAKEDPPPRRRPEPRLPNVLLIVTDDQAAGTLDVMPQVARWFGEGGTSFSRAYATTPLCCPSRASILTGRYAHNHGIVSNGGGTRLPPEATLPGILGQLGYRSAVAGKLFNGWPLEVDPVAFDRWAIFNTGYWNTRWNVDGELVDVAQYSTDFVRDRAIGFLQDFERRDRRPWFLLVAPFAPHGPFQPSADYASAPVPPWTPGPEMLEPNRSDKPPHVREREANLRQSSSTRTQQLRTLMSVDALVSDLMAALGALGEGRNTLAAYTSDNGYLWGHHGTEGKRQPYLPAVNVPFLLRWPGHVAAGAVDDRLVANVDLAPTVLRAAGFSAEAVRVLDGRSLFEPGARSRLLLEYWWDPSSTVPSWASVLAADYQYVEYYSRDGRSITFREYYDLAADPLQLRNVLADPHPENDPSRWWLGKLASTLAHDRGCVGRLGPSACP